HVRSSTGIGQTANRDPVVARSVGLVEQNAGLVLDDILEAADTLPLDLFRGDRRYRDLHVLQALRPPAGFDNDFLDLCDGRNSRQTRHDGYCDPGRSRPECKLGIRHYVPPWKRLSLWNLLLYI